MAQHGTEGRSPSPPPSFASLDHWRIVSVAGDDALGWLNDLITADVSVLEPGQAQRSLLLTPTGRIRAEFVIAAHRDRFVLLQDPRQPDPADRLLAPYVLSSKVAGEDWTERAHLFTCRCIEPPSIPDAWTSAPTWLGDGVDVVVPVERSDDLTQELLGVATRLSADDIEAARIAQGVPRWGTELTGAELPQEVGVEGAVALDKGCYLGQEAVARVRNLGHPRRLVLALRSPRTVVAGDAVMVDGTAAGRVTSATPWEDGSAALARVDWRWRAGPFRTATGAPLAARPSA